MTSVVVADTGPLIALARVGCLDLLRRLYREVTVPTAVEAELELTSERPGAAVLAAAFEDGWLRCTHIAPARDEVQELGRLLDAGEVEAIVLAVSARHRVSRAFLGTTADKVIRLSPCPVVVVPSGIE